MITICLTYYRSLTLANLEAALYSVRQQNLTGVREILIVDNNTDDAETDILDVIDSMGFPVPARLLSLKHGDRAKTHAWSTNVAVRAAQTEWVLFTRADYLLAFDAVERFLAALTDEPSFIVGGYYDVHVDIAAVEQTAWRQQGPSVLHPMGREYFHTVIDSGVWCTTRSVVEQVGGLDERLVAYGHAQTYFQHQVYCAGVPFVRVPEVLFYHPRHDYDVARNLPVAHDELVAIGGDLVACWARYDGPGHPRYDADGVFHG